MTWKRSRPRSPWRASQNGAASRLQHLLGLVAARVHARIWSDLATIGQPIGAHDLLIAATALAHGYAVLTNNLREFQRVAGLVVRQPNW
ncbi:MAG TPA: PIN domain-containing protein [Chloroflexota bacterium]|nr:PIN domain-containing protein [Chloroflexota bacterium]